MKILHTSDWHLNSVLGGRCPRNDDLRRSLQQIGSYLIERAVDVMIVSGDLFRERSSPEQLRAGIGIIKDCFHPFIQIGGTILAISGNHDSEVFFSTLRDAMDLISPVEASDDIHPCGRFYIAPNARNIKLQTPDGEFAQFVLMPYPTTRYLRKEESLKFQDFEQRNQAVGAAFKLVLRAQQEKLDPRWPAILVSHIAVRGVTTPAQYNLDQSNEVMLEPSDLSFPWTYVALGHLHRQDEAIPGAPHMRYAGSIERMDYGERNDKKSVVFLEIQQRQLLQTPETLSLQSTPFYEVEITDPQTQIPHLVLHSSKAIGKEATTIGRRLGWASPHPGFGPQIELTVATRVACSISWDWQNSVQEAHHAGRGATDPYRQPSWRLSQHARVGMKTW